MQPSINQMSEKFQLFVQTFAYLRSKFVLRRLPLDWNSAWAIPKKKQTGGVENIFF